MQRLKKYITNIIKKILPSEKEDNSDEYFEKLQYDLQMYDLKHNTKYFDFIKRTMDYTESYDNKIKYIKKYIALYKIKIN